MVILAYRWPDEKDALVCRLALAPPGMPADCERSEVRGAFGRVGRWGKERVLR
jgi:hypothetical protein